MEEATKKNFIAVQQWMKTRDKKIDDLETLIKQKDQVIGTLTTEIQQLKRQVTTIIARQYGNGSTS